ncbi:MAG: hypothetical protein HXX11_10495 [Desulfuromonadales bacterium]|nr:hypothetical protein [Desulfuromonadales bacterium]
MTEINTTHSMNATPSANKPKWAHRNNQRQWSAEKAGFKRIDTDKLKQGMLFTFR